MVTSFNGSSATFTPNGSYRIVIGSNNDASSGTYSLTLSAAQPPKIGGTVAAAAVTTPAAVFSTTLITDPVSQQILAN